MCILRIDAGGQGKFITQYDSTFRYICFCKTGEIDKKWRQKDVLIFFTMH